MLIIINYYNVLLKKNLSVRRACAVCAGLCGACAVCAGLCALCGVLVRAPYARDARACALCTHLLVKAGSLCLEFVRRVCAQGVCGVCAQGLCARFVRKVCAQRVCAHACGGLVQEFFS